MLDGFVAALLGSRYLWSTMEIQPRRMWPTLTIGAL